MSRLPWAVVSNGWLRSRLNATTPRERHEVPLRTVHNALTGQDETVRLTEFQQLLRQGKIQETIRWSRCSTPLGRVYRLV
jgi:hypothetical protein